MAFWPSADLPAVAARVSAVESSSLDSVLRAATVEEVPIHTWHPVTITVAGGEVFLPLLTAPWPLRVVAISMTHLGGDLALDTGNYWSFRPKRLRATLSGSPAVVTTDDTDLLTSDGGSWRCRTARKEFESFTIDGHFDRDLILWARDVLVLRVAPGGTPTDLSSLSITTRVEPVS
jgi:hypothetical protein